MLNHPSLGKVVPGGYIAANDDYRDRVVIINPSINPTANAIVWQYGHTDSPGIAPGYLNTSDGYDLLAPDEPPRHTRTQDELRSASIDASTGRHLPRPR